MEEALARGDLAWHALPFTWQTELLDNSAIKGRWAFPIRSTSDSARRQPAPR